MNTSSRDLISRRQFVRLGGAAVALGMGGGSLAAPAEEAPPIIDTHTHFYDPTRPQGVPWPGKEDKFLHRRVLPEDYMKLALPHGVTGTVVVEASSWIEDNQWVLDLAAKEKFLVGLVGRLEAGRPEFKDQLTRFARNPLFRGIRLGGQLRRGLDQPEFLADLQRLVDADLELDLNGGPDLLPSIAKLAARFPSLRIVINHVANVRIDGKAPPSDWLEGMREAGRHARVFCKVSGLVEGTRSGEGKAPADVEFYRPVLDAVWQCFGEERVIYGSNWPVSERFARYATVQRIVAGYFQAKGRMAARKFFSGNAQTAYRWAAR